LTISVEFATKITKKLEIRDAYTLENVRGKIIRIVTPIIAGSYVNGGDVPTEDSVKDLTELFDVLISFADSVSPTDEKGSKPTKIATMIEACDPILQAVYKNDLGLGAEKAFHESVSGLKARAEEMAGPLGLDDAIESGLFKSLVTLYTSCYEMIAHSNGTIEDVWRHCDERLAIIYGLTSYVADKAGIEMKKEPAPKKVSAEKELDKGQDKENNEKDNDDDDDDGDENPMSFFASG
jgi:hypothetical protein